MTASELDTAILDKVAARPGDDDAARIARIKAGASLYRAYIRGAEFLAFWLQYGNWDPSFRSAVKRTFES